MGLCIENVSGQLTMSRSLQRQNIMLALGLWVTAVFFRDARNLGLYFLGNNLSV